MPANPSTSGRAFALRRSLRVGLAHSRTCAGASTVAGLAAAVASAGTGVAANTGVEAAVEAVAAFGVSTLGDEVANALEAGGDASACEVVASIPGTTELAAAVSGSADLAASFFARLIAGSGVG